MVPPLGELEHSVLRLAQLGGGGIQFILGRRQLPLGVRQLGGGLLQVGLQPLALCIQPLQLIGPGQDARRAGHRAAGHGAAGVEHLAVQGDDAEAPSKLPGDGQGLVHILGDDHPAQQAGEDGSVLRVKGDDGVPHTHKARLPLHRLVPEIRWADGVHGQNGGPACVSALQILDDGLAVLLPVHHQVLHGSAKGDLDGHGIPVGHVEQPGHRPPDAFQSAPARLAHHQLYRLGVTLVHLLHLGEHMDA